MLNLNKRSKKELVKLLKTLTRLEQENLFKKYTISLMSTKLNEVQISWERFIDIDLHENEYNEFFNDLINSLKTIEHDEAVDSIKNMLSYSDLDLTYHEGYYRVSIKGSFCRIFLSKEDEGIVVIKKLTDRNPVAEETFKREQVILSRLDKYSNVSRKSITLKVFSADSLTIKMEKGESSLKNIIENGSDLDIKSILEIIDKIKSLHDLGIIHRDLHPGNFMLKNNQWYIIDFNISSMEYTHSLISIQNNCGVPEYTDPRIYINGLNISNRQTDIYSVGKVINYALTKNPNNYNHKYGKITSRCTCDSLDERYKVIDEIIFDIQKENPV